LELLQIENEFNELVKSYESEDDILNAKELKSLTYLIENSKYVDIINALKTKTLSSISVEDVILLSDELSKLNAEIIDIKNEIELEHFFKNGKLISKSKLRELYHKRNIKDKFPTLKLNKLFDLIEHPFYEVKTPKGDLITFDKFYVKKTITALVQMIFNEMDLKIINCGEEGSGKSAWASQQIRFLYLCLSYIGVINYEYDECKIIYSSVESYIEDKDLQKEDEHFVIRCLDEAYDLNRQNFRELTNKIFKDEMRRGRKRLNIDVLNLPQLGELEVAITLSRTNFIYICAMDNDVKTMTLDKGHVEMYIIPRANKIYSPHYRKNILKSEIKRILAKLLEKKENYYLEMPKEILIHKFDFPEVWGFDWKKYKTHVIRQSKEKRLSGDVSLSEYEQYIIYKKLPETKHFGTFDLKNKFDKRMYDVWQKKIKYIKNKFVNNLDLLGKYEIMYGGKDKLIEEPKTIKEDLKQKRKV